MSFDEHSLLRALQSWSIDHRIEQAAAERAAVHWQQQLAGEETSLQAVFDHAASSALSVAIVTANATRRGTVAVVGTDFCGITEQGRTTLIAFRAISAVQLDAPWKSTLATPLEIDSRPRLADALSYAVEHRPRIRVCTLGNSNVRAGDLVAVGTDILVIDQTGPPRRTTLIPIDELAEVSL